MKTMKILMLFVLAVIFLTCQKEDEIEIKEEILMPDGKTWTAKNLEIIPVGFEGETWWYNNAQANAKYGRLYTYEAAKAACQQLGDGWRLPTKAEWRDLATAYGPFSAALVLNYDAYENLIDGGNSGFDALLGGWRQTDGSFHGLRNDGSYWSATEYGSLGISCYSFSVYYHALLPFVDNKDKGFSCRCVRN